MFKVGEIYKFQKIIDSPLFYSYNMREYVTDNGEVCPKILVKEQCITNDISKEGWYRIRKIKDEKTVENDIGAISHYDMQLELEFVAPFGWYMNISAIELLETLDELGFYTDYRIIKENDKDDLLGFGIDVKRGILILLETSGNDLMQPYMVFFHPPVSFLRHVLMESLKNHDDYSSYSCLPPENTKDYCKTYVFRPDIIYKLRNYTNDLTNFKPSKKMPLRMPLVNNNRFRTSFWGNNRQKDTYKSNKEEYKKYYLECREIFNTFPNDVKIFLKEFTDVEERYFSEKPWDKFFIPSHTFPLFSPRQ